MLNECPQRASVCSDQNFLVRLQLGNNDRVPVLKSSLVGHPARLRPMSGVQSPGFLHRNLRLAALPQGQVQGHLRWRIHFEMVQSVAPPALLCHKEPDQTRGISSLSLVLYGIRLTCMQRKDLLWTPYRTSDRRKPVSR